MDPDSGPCSGWTVLWMDPTLDTEPESLLEPGLEVSSVFAVHAMLSAKMLPVPCAKLTNFAVLLRPKRHACAKR